MRSSTSAPCCSRRSSCISSRAGARSREPCPTPLDARLPEDLHLRVRPPQPRSLLAALVVAAAYVAAGRFGIAQTRVAHGLITPVWAPTGIAIAGLLLGGRRLWPAVAAG